MPRVFRAERRTSLSRIARQSYLVCVCSVRYAPRLVLSSERHPDPPLKTYVLFAMLSKMCMFGGTVWYHNHFSEPVLCMGCTTLMSTLR